MVLNGRWIIKELNDDRAMVSIEYQNDWELDVSYKFVDELEKVSSIRSVKDIIRYTLD